jgi:hypothetical protein
VPKAAVNKHREPVLLEKEIWLADYIAGMFHPAPNFLANQDLFNGSFGRSIPAALYFGHQGRPLNCRERIGPARCLGSLTHMQLLFARTGAIRLREAELLLRQGGKARHCQGAG